MRKVSIGSALLALGLGIAMPAHAAAPTVTKVKFKGQSAFGAAEHHDGCIDAFMSVTASDETTKDSTGTNTQRSAFVGYGGRDLCQFLSFGGAEVVPLDVSLNDDSVTIPFSILIDYANTETDERTQRRFAGSITIVANGDFEKTRDTTILLNDGIKTVTKQRGNTREATATVNATLDGVPFSFDPGTGSLGTVKQGTVESTRF